MQRKEMRRAIRRRYKKIKQAFRFMCEDFNADAIHDFRVQVKKLRALLHLVATAKKGRRVRKIPYGLRQVYTMAGRIRTYQLQEEVVSQEVASLRNYAVQLQMHALHLTGIAQQQRAATKSLDKEAKQLQRRLPKRLSRKEVNRFVQKSLRPIHVVQFSPNLAHGMRKGLKDLQYTWPILQQYQLPALSLQESTIKECTDLVGRYLDTGIQLQLIRSDQQALPPRSETRQSMEALESKWEADWHELQGRLQALLSHQATASSTAVGPG